MNFVFNQNKCVGCEACSLACAIEKGSQPPLFLRNVSTFNKFQHPYLPLFHQSLACNHCYDAPCLENCPALAYRRDEKTGAVLHIKENCIGCKYCTWVCPYDAPKYNKKSGIVEKCDFCNQRILKGGEPSCTFHCPTGALKFEKETRILLNKRTQGFANYGIEPFISIIPLERNRQVPEIATNELSIPSLALLNAQTDKSEKINMKHEWPLLIFTLYAAIMVGLTSAQLFMDQIFKPKILLSLGIATFLLSSIHLGKKLKAYRAIFNLKNSWLSREIASFSAFLVLFALAFIVMPGNRELQWLCLATGYFALFCIDMVYHPIAVKRALNMHSAHLILTAFLIFGLAAQNQVIVISIAVIKVVLYVWRKLEFFKNRLRAHRWASATRLDLLISYPLLVGFLGWAHWYFFVVISIIAGEIMDRIEFYQELKVITPQKQIDDDLRRVLENGQK
jgi:Fe-S-cluster-containing dehydrogenase component/DMSO reductase anchor subunit